MNDKLIVALDVDTIKEVRQLLNKLHKKVKIFKIGPHLFTRYGPDIIKLVHSFGCRVFLDLKLHDIPNTVSNAVRQITKLKVFMLTVHTLGGSEMMKAAHLAARQEAKKIKVKRPIILGITVLSSFNKKDLKEINIKNKLDTQVLHLAKLAEKSNFDGVVLSAKEADKVKEACGKNFIIVCPGIRLKKAAKNDQKRVATPKEALSKGADYIVVGRPIIKSSNPLKAVEDILKEISEA